MLLHPFPAPHRTRSKKNSVVGDEGSERFANSLLFGHAREGALSFHHLRQLIRRPLFLRRGWEKRRADARKQRPVNNYPLAHSRRRMTVSVDDFNSYVLARA